MKKIVLSLGILMFVFGVMAQNVSQQQAETIAKNYMNNRYPALTFNKVSEVISHKNNQNEIVYYVFNFEDGGFTMVAADKRVNPILAYSPEDNYKEGLPGVEDFVSAYEAKITDVKAEVVQPDVTASVQWAEIECCWSR